MSIRILAAIPAILAEDFSVFSVSLASEAVVTVLD
jgi:hypothetical protein